MAIDPLEVCRMELRDFGIPVSVAPPEGEAFSCNMLFYDEAEDVVLGGLAGCLENSSFLCLPENDVLIIENTLLTCEDGSEYLVYGEPIRRVGQFTLLRVHKK